MLTSSLTFHPSSSWRLLVRDKYLRLKKPHWGLNISALVTTALTAIMLLQIVLIEDSDGVPMVLTQDEYDMSGLLLFVTGCLFMSTASWLTRKTGQRNQQASHRLGELYQFVHLGKTNANLVHEIANPLTAATLTLDLLAANGSKHVRLVQAHLNQVRRYLDGARQQLSGNMVLTDVNIAAETQMVLESLRPRAEAANVTLRLCVNQETIWHGDAVKFSQVMANLIANAIDAYDGKSRSERIVAIKIAALQTGLKCTVSDKGCGMSIKQQQQIFEPFFTTKLPNSPHLGIGLSSVKQFVDHDFKGQIAVTSAPQQGTTFSIWLPFEPAAC